MTSFMEFMHSHPPGYMHVTTLHRRAISYLTALAFHINLCIALGCLTAKRKKKEKTYPFIKVFAPAGLYSVYEKYQLSLINSFVWNKLIVNEVKLVRLAKVIYGQPGFPTDQFFHVVTSSGLDKYRRSCDWWWHHLFLEHVTLQQ